MKVQMSARVMGQAEVLRQLHGLTGQQAARAYAKAINDTGFEVRRAMQAEMQAVFDRPTNYILKSPRVVMAKPSHLSATIEPAYMGGNGIDPQKILQAQEQGGPRSNKRSEEALRRAGILPNGLQTAIPGDEWGGPYPGSHDGKGNLTGTFLRHILSYFQAFGEGQGYKANMLDKTKARLHRGTKKKAGRHYFVSYGPMRDNRAQHLPAGIWAASGTHGVDVRPVLLFTKRGKYTPRFEMDKVADRADVENYLPRRIRYRLREAAGV